MFGFTRKGTYWSAENNTEYTVVYSMSKCMAKCAKLEHSKFAKKCRKESGYFKCCVNSFTLNVFESSRNHLIREGLMKGKESHVCKIVGKEKTDPCSFCTLGSFCTKTNPLTGEIDTTTASQLENKDKFEGKMPSGRHNAPSSVVFGI